MASRTTVRLTWSCCANTASVGSFCAAWMRPARISTSSALATWSESLALGLTAEKGEDMEWVGRAVWGVNVAPAVVGRPWAQ